MRIDVHAHHLPGHYLEALRAGDGPAMAKPHDDATLAAMIDAQDAAGIDMQVLSTGPNAPYMRDAALAERAARIANDAFADVVDRHGGRFAAYGCVPPAACRSRRCRGGALSRHARFRGHPSRLFGAGPSDR